MIYLCDIDGTIADCSHRLHFIQGEKKDWPAFFKACVDDKPIEDIIDLITDLESLEHTIAYVTGRSDEVEKETCDWLYKNVGTENLVLYMRKAGDHREDKIIKSEILDDILNDYFREEKIAGVFEDRQQCVDMYRARGLRVYQVAKGDF